MKTTGSSCLGNLGNLGIFRSSTALAGLLLGATACGESTNTQVSVTRVAPAPPAPARVTPLAPLQHPAEAPSDALLVPALRPFLRGCATPRFSFLEGATFVHVTRPTGDPNALPWALRVLPNGEVSELASTRGSAAFGDATEGVWMSADFWKTAAGKNAPPRFDHAALSLWDGAKWARARTYSDARPFWAHWKSGAYLRVMSKKTHGTIAVLESTGATPSNFEAPAELSRFDVRGVTTLPETGIVLLNGSVDGKGSYSLIAGTAHGLLRNDTNTNYDVFAARENRLLVSQLVSNTAARAVRVSQGSVTPGELFPAVPAALAIDAHNLEWMVSFEGDMYRRTSLAAPWEIAASFPDARATTTPIRLRPIGGDVWVVAGGALYRTRGPLTLKVPLPADIGPEMLVSDIEADHEGRLWVVVVRPRDGQTTLLTSGAAPKTFACEEVTPG